MKTRQHERLKRIILIIKDQMIEAGKEIKSIEKKLGKNNLGTTSLLAEQYKQWKEVYNEAKTKLDILEHDCLLEAKFHVVLLNKKIIPVKLMRKYQTSSPEAYIDLRLKELEEIVPKDYDPERFCLKNVLDVESTRSTYSNKAIAKDIFNELDAKKR